MFEHTIGPAKEVQGQAALSARLCRIRKGLRKRLVSEKIGEDGSPLHTALLEKDFYRDSDSTTRRLMRRQLMRFAKRHRLTEMQAISLWEGESCARRLPVKGLTWLPILLTATALPVGCVLCWDRLGIGSIGLCLLLVCPIRESFALLTEGAIRLLLPAAPLSVLKREKAPAVCAMLVASVNEDTEQVLRRLEMLVAANREADALFGLILTLPDAPARHLSSDSALCEPFLRAFEALEGHCGKPLRLCIAERTYRPRERYWAGAPSPDALASACGAMLAGEDAPFLLSVGKRNPVKTPDALYIAPADSILAPDGLRTLACTLFHPLCKADCVLPILSTAGEGEAAVLDDRLKALAKRQVTLQKAGASLPYSGYGMIRLSALGRTAPARLSSALAVCTLFVKALPSAPERDRPSEEERSLILLPALRARVGALMRLPLYLSLISAPPVLALGGLMLSSADLLTESLLSFRLGQRLRTHTLPQIFRAAHQALGRLIFPAQQFFSALPPIDRLSGRARGLLSALFAAAVGVATASLFPLPLSAIGLVWALSPLLATLSAEKRRSSALSAADRGNLLAWGRKSWTFFEKNVNDAHPLPPVGIDGQSASPLPNDSSPDALAFYLIACLSACDLGWIDPFTLEKRVHSALDAWERLPTYHGLPYARYSLESGEPSGQCGVSTVLCGQYALALAALSEGLLDHAEQNGALEALAERVNRLWQKMDFTRLYDRAQSAFFETLLPSGEGIGRLDLLMGGAKAACIASLALGQIDHTAWKNLRRPAVGKGFRLGMASRSGRLDEYLLDALFLPASEESLIGRARSYACRSLGAESARLVSYDASLALMPDDRLRERAMPHTAFLMLPFRPKAAVKYLHRFEALGASDQLGFFEAIEGAQGEERVLRMRSSAHIGQSLAALVNCLRANLFCRRLMRKSAFAALIPLLNEPFDRLEAPLPRRPALPLSTEETTVDADLPSLFLLGDSRWGVLWADGRRLLPFYKGRATAYCASPHTLYEDGHFSGLLLFRRGRAITVSPAVCRRERGAITLAYRGEGVSLQATLTLPEDGLLSLALSCEQSGEPLSVLFCYSPLPREGRAFRLETLPLGDLLLIREEDRVAALAAEGLDAPFIRAEEAPFPLGIDSLATLTDRKASFTEGSLLTPACRIGGKLSGRCDCRFLLAFGKDRDDLLGKLARARRSARSAPPEEALIPLPSEDGSARSYALSLELQCLFESLRLRRFSPAPSDIAPSPNLLRSLGESLKTLEARGFEADEEDYPLPRAGDLPTDEYLKALLCAPARPPLTSPPLPERTRIRLTEGTLTVAKGLDLPPVCRLYADRTIAFFADSYTPSFRFEGADEPTPIILTLPEPSAHTPTERSLFYGAREVRYGEGEVCYTGEGYAVRAFLSEVHRLLVLEVRADRPVSIRLGDLPPSRSTDEGDFWHRADGRVDFCSRIEGDGRTLFLLGSFDRSSDRRYYLAREEMNRRLRAQMPLSDGASASDMLTWQSGAPYPTPLLVHTALASSAPECFPLLLFFREEDAYDALARLFSTDKRTLQVAACLLWERFTEDRESLRRKIVHPTASGEVEESVYLSAARALDALCEEEGDSPLLDHLVTSFAELAHRMGDYAGEESYRERVCASGERSSAPPETLEEIAAGLLEGDLRAAAAWKERIDTLPLFPSPTEASALWALFWYGILGYRETPRGFTLSPLPCGALEDCAFSLRRRETLYRVRVTRSDRRSCLLDGKNAEMPFLFDKNDHFLEITVEKSRGMV